MSNTPRKFGLFRNARQPTVYPPNTTVFAAGDEGQEMYAIKRGKVAILVQGKVIDTLGEEEVFGEMALLERKARAATVVTLEETELVEINETQFYLLVRQNPHFTLQLMRLLSERLRNTDELYKKADGE
jgi:CRP-like cAMP-binding protein